MNTDCFNSRESFNAALCRLSDYRRKKLEKYKKESDRRLSLAAGYLIDKGLGELGLCEKNMKYISGENGKPYFLGYEKIFFNISHTEKTAVCVFSDTETGCDIEKPREYSDRFVRRFFSENECSRIENSNNKPYEFIRIWTRKESFLKAYGSGITQRLSELDTLEDTKKIGNDVYYFTEYGTIRNAFLTVCSKNRRFCSDITEISI